MHTFTVSDMTCGGCAAAITQAIQRLDSTATVEADPATKLVKVESPKPAAEIAQAIAGAGYRVAE
jgi:copper chaperone